MPKRARRWTVAAAQMRSAEDREANLDTAERLARRAAAAGADLVAFPENFTFLRVRSEARHAESRRGATVARLLDLARRTGTWILAGSIPEAIRGSDRVYNTSLLIDPDGCIAASYRKMHLFDVRLPGRVVFEESLRVRPGRRVVVARTPLGALGLTICYDLRFPELYRRLALAGAQVIFVPAAFTAYTGRAHWLTLLRARAIENQCWIVAPAQSGVHGPGRESYGRTAVVDPWGEVTAMRRVGTGLVLAEIDLGRVDAVRGALPSLAHARRDLVGGTARVL